MKQKKYNRGLIIGKFYPLHVGHCDLIETGLRNSNQLVVIVCQTDRYKIPATIRASWIKELYPSAEVKILEHNESLDSDSVEISQKWAKVTTKFLGYAPDVVFSSEEYGTPYASHMGSEHVLVDLERKKFNTSGTKIRKNIYGLWEYISSPAKAYFAKRIVILGAESTGTTTLAKDLAQYFETTWVPEYGRSYSEGKLFGNVGQKWTTSEFVHIVEMQNQIEEAMARICNQFLICDTDALATTIWHKRYVGSRSKDVEKMVNSDKYSLYILTDTDIPFVQDGTRDGEHLRNWMNQEMIKILNKRKLNYIIVSGSKEERLQKAVAMIKELPNKYIYE